MHTCCLSGHLKFSGNVFLSGVETYVQGDEGLAQCPQSSITVLKVGVYEGIKGLVMQPRWSKAEEYLTSTTC